MKSDRYKKDTYVHIHAQKEGVEGGEERMNSERKKVNIAKKKRKKRREMRSAVALYITLRKDKEEGKGY